MSYKINDTVVVDDSRNVCACCVTSDCITASSEMVIPSGTTACRPTGSTGSLYFDTDEGALVAYDGTEWAAQGGGGMPTSDTVNTKGTYTAGGGDKDFNCKWPVMPYNNAIADMSWTACGSTPYCAWVIPKATARLQQVIDYCDRVGCCYFCNNWDFYISPDLNFVSFNGRDNCCNAVYGFGLEKYFCLKSCGPSNSRPTHMACIGNRLIVGHDCCCHFSVYCIGPSTGINSRIFLGSFTSGSKTHGIYETSTGDIGFVIADLNLNLKFVEVCLTDPTCVLFQKSIDNYANSCAVNQHAIAQTTGEVGVVYSNLGAGSTYVGLVFDKISKCFRNYNLPEHCASTPNYANPMNINDNIYFKDYNRPVLGVDSSSLYKVSDDLSAICGGVRICGQCCAWGCVNGFKLWPRHGIETVSFPYAHRGQCCGMYGAWATICPCGSPGSVLDQACSSPFSSGYCIFTSALTCSCPSFCSGTGIDRCTVGVLSSGCSGDLPSFVYVRCYA